MPQEAVARAPWVLEEYEHVALVLHLLQAPVPLGVDDLDYLHRVSVPCAAQRAEAHLAKGTLTQLVLDIKVARLQDLLAGLGGGSGWRFGSRARPHTTGPTVNARAVGVDFGEFRLFYITPCAQREAMDTSIHLVEPAKVPT